VWAPVGQRERDRGMRVGTVNLIRQSLQDAGLGRLATAIESRSQPSLRLIAGKRGSQNVGRFGGQPNMPKGVTWPTWKGGQPLSFIAQFELAALPRLQGLPLPDDGSLFFFYDADNQPWGYDPKDAGCCKVIYSPSRLSENSPRRPHPDLDEEGRFKAMAVAATVETSLPSTSDGLLGDLHATDEEVDAYLSLVDPLKSPVYRMGGHADQIQGDIRLEAQLVSNGIYCGDANGYAQGRKKGLDAGASDWRLLLQVDSEKRTGMYWGGSGRIYFLIRHSDLQDRRFEKVWLVLQCT
jgi:uncharacterized protein YwqG